MDTVPDPALQPAAWRFGEFRLEPRERRLLCSGQLVALTPKVFDLLVLLVQNAGHVLTKDQLLETLWRGRLVTESNLTKHVWMLRRALGETDDGGRFVETVSKVGYRFVAALVAEPVAEGAAQAPEPAAAAAMVATVDAALPVAPAMANPRVHPATDPIDAATVPQGGTTYASVPPPAPARNGNRVVFAALATGLVALVVTLAWRYVAPRESAATSTQVAASPTAQSGTAPQPAEGASPQYTPAAGGTDRITAATTALRIHDAATARDDLLEAVAAAPDDARAYVRLSQAWSQLGYETKARAAAEQARAHLAGADPVLRLQVETQHAAARFDWTAAVASARAQVASSPHDPEANLQLVQMLLAADKTAEARAASKAMADAGIATGEPRALLADARIASALGDAKGSVLLATQALDAARAQNAPALAADAQVLLGVKASYTDPAAAITLLGDARNAYSALRNPHGECVADQSLGNVYIDSDPKRARGLYQRALAECEAIGDTAGMASAYSELGIMLWDGGDLDGAVTAVRHVLAIRRATGNVAGQAWALTALATIQSDAAADDATVTAYREALKLDEAAQDHGHHAFTTMSLADVLRVRGELAEATALCTQARAEYAGAKDQGGMGMAALVCAEVALDRGDMAATRTALADAATIAQASGDAMTAGNVNVMLGQIDLGERNWPQAVTELAAARQGFAKAELVSGQAIADSLQALAYARLGKPVERDRAAAEARALRTRITQQQEVFAVDLALAQLGGDTGDRMAALGALKELASDARQRHWLSWSLEAQLAALDVRDPSGHGAGAEMERRQLVASAGEHGFGWVAQRAAGHSADIAAIHAR